MAHVMAGTVLDHILQILPPDLSIEWGGTDVKHVVQFWD